MYAGIIGDDGNIAAGERSDENCTDGRVVFEVRDSEDEVVQGTGIGIE